jgi:hypothetical protein
MADEPKEEKYLDRYEVVAVALPGAAMLLYMWYLHPELLGATKFDLKDVSIGSLGIFTVASVIAGQVVQAFANIVEELLNLIADLIGRTPVDSLPRHRQVQFSRAVKSAGINNPDALDRRRYRKELGKEISRTARQRDQSGMLQVANVSYGLHRGLAVASGIAIIVALFGGTRLQVVVLALIFAATTYRAIRFSRRYEGEALRLFLDPPISK